MCWFRVSCASLRCLHKWLDCCMRQRVKNKYVNTQRTPNTQMMKFAERWVPLQQKQPLPLIFVFWDDANTTSTPQRNKIVSFRPIARYCQWQLNLKLHQLCDYSYAISFLRGCEETTFKVALGALEPQPGEGGSSSNKGKLSTLGSGLKVRGLVYPMKNISCWHTCLHPPLRFL